MFIDVVRKVTSALIALVFLGTCRADQIAFALHAFGVKDSQVIIETDEAVLVPALSSIKLSRETLLPIIPYSSTDTDQAEAVFRELETHHELSLGHSQVYFYLALNHALDRIYRNIVLTGTTGRSESEKDFIKGLDSKYGTVPDKEKLFSNLRDVTSVQPLAGQKIYLQVFFSKTNFDRAAMKIGLHSAKAFWDPTSIRIGFYFDAQIFRWYKARAIRQGQSDGEAAQQVRDYVIKESLDSIAHELVHVAQRSSGNHLGNTPFLAEGAALFVQANISMREDLSRLTREQVRRTGSVLPPPDSPCLALKDASPPFYSASLIQFQRGIEVARKGMALDQILLLNDDSFYSQDSKALKDEYDGALAFVMFVAAMSRERFETEIGPFLGDHRHSVSASSLKLLSRDFRDWAEGNAQEWWASKSAEDTYEQVQRLTDYCLDRREYTLAYVGSALMFVLNPSSPTPFLYAGDVFFRVDIPFFAFDFYTLSNEWRERFGVGGDSPLRIDSRLGDAFEEVGDIQSAVDWYSRLEVLQQKAVPPEAGITWFRSRLKRDFYQSALSGGYAHEDGALFLVNSYVQQFQGESCANVMDKGRLARVMEAAKTGDIAEYWKDLKEDYESVLKEIHSDRAINKLDEIVKLRRQNCSEKNDHN